MDLPIGVVTMVFTDVEGSTRLLQRIGDAYFAVLAARHSAIRGAAAEHSGTEVDNAGDGFFFAFSTSTSAIEFAVAAQRAIASDALLAAHGVRVRVGAHTGEVQVVGDTYVGLAVHLAARIASAAHGGQVLVSNEARTLAASTTVDYVDLGEHHLKDLAHPVRIWQVTHPGLEATFAPVRSLNRGRANLPTTRTSFVGRDNEIKELLELLDSPGVVTLTGPGGTGKTRLAIETARQAVNRFDAGVWFVDLQPASEPAHVEQAVAQALDVVDSSAGVDMTASPLDRVEAKIADGCALIVLDNCEHLLSACASAVQRLLGACPNLGIIATSRELLGVADEIARRVPSLTDDAVDLFVDRARRVAPHLIVDEQTREVIARICHRLDGIPLAIELAAAKVRHLTPQMLEDRLDDRFRVLIGSDRRSLQRHQTLEAVVGWSHDLLSDDERTAFRNLGVFPAAFSLDAASVVCDEATLFSLVDRSLVEYDGNDRYRLLETIRLYAQARLAQSGEDHDVREQHTAYFAEFAEHANLDMRGANFYTALARIGEETDNIRGAIEWSVAAQRPDLAVRLGGAVAFGWSLAGRFDLLDQLIMPLFTLTAQVDDQRAGRLHLGVALGGLVIGTPDYLGHAPDALRLLDGEGDGSDWLWATMPATLLKSHGEDPEATPETARAGLAMAERVGEFAVAAVLTASMGWAQMRLGNLDEARVHLTRAAELAQRSESEWPQSAASFWLGILLANLRDYEAAKPQYLASLAVMRKLPYKLGAQWELDHLVTVCLGLDDLAGARAFAEEGIALSREAGLVGQGNYPFLIAKLGSIELLADDPDQALLSFTEALRLITEEHGAHTHATVLARSATALARIDRLDDARARCLDAVVMTRPLARVQQRSAAWTDPPVDDVLWAAAEIMLTGGDATAAAELLGAASAAHENNDADMSPPRQRELATLTDGVRAACGDEEQYSTAFARGRALADPLTVAAKMLA